VFAQIKWHWNADHDFGYLIDDERCSDFFDFLVKVALNVWDEEEDIERDDEGESVRRSRFQRRFSACPA
jgi:hypothetical protein